MPHAPLWRMPRFAQERPGQTDLDLALALALIGRTNRAFLSLRGALELLKQQKALEAARQTLRIAVAGRIKAGKSTLLNAMFGGQICFPSAETVCTGLPIRVVRGREGIRLQLRFADGRTETHPGVEGLGRYGTKEGTAAHGVVDLCLEWGHEGYPAGLEIVDTPGFEDTNPERCALAAKIVEQSDLLLFAVSLRGGGLLTDSDLRVIRSFAKARGKGEQGESILVVLTAADQEHSASDLRKKILSARKCLKTEGLPRATVHPVSALKALAALLFRERAQEACRPTPDLGGLRRQAKQKLHGMGVHDMQGAGLRDLIRRVQAEEGYRACFDSTCDCDRMECAWFNACASGAPRKMVPGILADMQESPAEVLRSLRTLRRVIGAAPDDPTDEAQSIWHASNLGTILRAPDGAWDRKVARAEEEVREMLWKLAKTPVPEPEIEVEGAETPATSVPPPVGQPAARLLQDAFEGPGGIRFRKIPKGEFWHGPPDGPKFRRLLDHDFYIAETPVTNGQWIRVNGRPYTAWDDYQPKTCVSRGGIFSFLMYMNAAGDPPSGWHYRLPTEYEWEAASRAGSDTAWCFGNDTRRLRDYAVCKGGPNAERLCSVKQKQPNAYGLYDMHGLVAEAVGQGADKTCGGAFNDHPADTRNGLFKPWDGRARETVGFRLVLARR